MRERTSNDAIVFRTLAVVDFLGGPAVQVYYRGQWLVIMGLLKLHVTSIFYLSSQVTTMDQ